jgi:hypothetical protein
MLIKFSDTNGSPLYINPRYVVAVREEKHVGRPGVAADSEYRDTRILTTEADFNVQEAPDDVVRELNRAEKEMLGALKPASAADEAVLPPRGESA